MAKNKIFMLTSVVVAVMVTVACVLDAVSTLEMVSYFKSVNSEQPSSTVREEFMASDISAVSDAIVIRSIKDNGKFYPSPNDPMAAFDDSNDSFLAGLEGDGPWSFELLFAQPQMLRDIEIEFYNMYNYATDFVVKGYNGIFWETLIEKKNYKLDAYSRFFYYRLRSERSFEKIEITITGVTGQKRPLIHNIKFNAADPLKKHYANAAEAAADIILYDLTENSLEDIRTWDRLNEHEKCMLFLKWVAENISGNGEGNADTYLDFNEKIGVCGDVSQMMVAFANALGMEARVICIFNSPFVGYGHVVTEVKWGGEWHLYDSSVGTYYLGSDMDSGNVLSPHVLSAEDIRNDPELVANRMIVNWKIALNSTVIEPFRWQNWISTIDSSRYNVNGEGGLVVPNGGLTNPEFYAAAEPFGAVGPEYPMLFPAYLSLKTGEAGYGSADNSFSDLIAVGEIYQGMHFIGSSIWNVNQEYRMTDLKPGQEYRLKIGFLTADNISTPFEIDVSGEGLEIFGETKAALQSGDTLEVRFAPSFDQAKLRLSHSYTSGEYITLDYIEILAI